MSPSCVGKATLSKTKMCTFRARGECRRGQSCSFAHAESELVAQPNLHKTRFCTDYLSGSCRRADKCKFAHSPEEIRPVPMSTSRENASGHFAESVCRQVEMLERKASILQQQLQTLQHVVRASRGQFPCQEAALCDKASEDVPSVQECFGRQKSEGFQSQVSTEDGESSRWSFSRQTTEEHSELGECEEGTEAQLAAGRDAGKSGLSCEVRRIGTASGMQLSVKRTFLVASLAHRGTSTGWRRTESLPSPPFPEEGI